MIRLAVACGMVATLLGLLAMLAYSRRRSAAGTSAALSALLVLSVGVSLILTRTFQQIGAMP